MIYLILFKIIKCKLMVAIFNHNIREFNIDFK